MSEPFLKRIDKSSLHSQRADSTIEYVGIVAVIVVLIAVLLRAAPGLGTQLGAGVDRAIEKVTEGGGSSGADGAGPSQPEPGVQQSHDAAEQPLSVNPDDLFKEEGPSGEGSQPGGQDGWQRNKIANSSSEWYMPFDGYGEDRVVQGYNPNAGGWYGTVGHRGVDFGIPEGTTLYAVTGGTVVYAGHPTRNTPYGVSVQVVIRTDDGKYVAYLHMLDIDDQVVTGQRVEAGQPIGHSDGDPNLHPPEFTGISDAPHVDISVSNTFSWNNAINPNAYLGLPD